MESKMNCLSDFESMLKLYSKVFKSPYMDYKTLKNNIAHHYRFIAWLHNEQGWSYGDISKKIGLSRQRVYMIVKKWPEISVKVDAFLRLQIKAYQIKKEYRNAISKEWSLPYNEAYKQIAMGKHGLSRLRMGLAWILVERGIGSSKLVSKLAGYKNLNSGTIAHAAFADLLEQGNELALRIKKAIDNYGGC